ncbi:MAG: TIGR03067 domain-containing protein [Gemmataceae bacterium]
MKRLLAWLLIAGVFVSAAPVLVDQARADDKDKKEEKKKDDKKDDKKEEKKDDKPKVEEKLTDAQKEELKKLTGTYSVTLFERDGKRHTPEQLKKMKVIQKGAEYSFHDGDDITQGKDIVYPEKNPKEIDSVYLTGTARGKTVKGLYKMDGDSITYAWADPDKDRPKEIPAKAEGGVTLMTLKRVKDEKPEEKGKKDEKKAEKKEEKKGSN